MAMSEGCAYISDYKVTMVYSKQICYPPLTPSLFKFLCTFSLFILPSFLPYSVNTYIESVKDME